jgi:hypothetical protein
VPESGPLDLGSSNRQLLEGGAETLQLIQATVVEMDRDEKTVAEGELLECGESGQIGGGVVVIGF